MSLRVETAALRKDGKVYTLPRPARHHDVMRSMPGHTPGMGSEQGFVLSDGSFVNRIVAAEVAQKAGQILPGRIVRARTLTTEELW